MSLLGPMECENHVTIQRTFLKPFLMCQTSCQALRIQILKRETERKKACPCVHTAFILVGK